MMSESRGGLPRVSLITVNLNGRAHLEVLLASLAEQTYPADRLEVIVVDNGSTDDSVSFLQSTYPHVKILCNAANEGFARPNNQAAAVATGELLALVNNDMRLMPDWVERMVDFKLRAGEDVGCVGSRILSWDGTAVDFIRGTMAFNGIGFQPGYGALLDNPLATDYPAELLFACGGAMLVPKDVFLESGGFDEDYFAYYEDVDFGWRLWVLGYRVLFCPEAVVHHRHNGTSSRFDWHKKVVLFERNAMCSVFKNYEEATLQTVWPAALLLAFKRIGVRSELDRHSFRFGPRPPRPETAGQPESPVRQALRSLRQLGLKHTLKKICVVVAQKVLTRWGGRPYEFDASPGIKREAYATVVGMEDFIDLLPRMQAKRRDIQARRRRSDAEVFRRFGEALKPVEGLGDYHAAHEQVLRELGVTGLFEAAERLPADAR